MAYYIDMLDNGAASNLCWLGDKWDHTCLEEEKEERFAQEFGLRRC